MTRLATYLFVVSTAAVSLAQPEPSAATPEFEGCNPTGNKPKLRNYSLIRQANQSLKNADSTSMIIAGIVIGTGTKIATGTAASGLSKPMADYLQGHCQHRPNKAHLEIDRGKL